MDLDDHEGAIERELPPLCRGCDEPTSEPTMHDGWIWCPKCADELADLDRDPAYERAAARARSNDFEDTDGRDWT